MKIQTVKRAELTNRAMIAGNEDKYTRVIVDGTVRMWVGFGWVNEGKPSASERKTLPKAID